MYSKRSETETENPNQKPDTRIKFSGTRTEIFIFFNRVPEPIILSGYRFGYGSDSLPKRVPDNPIFFCNFFIFFLNQWPNAPICNLLWALRASHGLNWSTLRSKQVKQPSKANKNQKITKSECYVVIVWI